MSSPNCPKPSRRVDARRLVSSVTAVAEQSFFAFVDLPATPPDPPAEGESWLEACVAFAGPFSGQLWLDMPDALARDLFVSFLGLEPEAEAADQALQDLVGEFANMTCGAWLTSQDAAECFALGHPEVRRVGCPRGDAAVVVAVNDRPIGLTLEVEEGA